MIRNNLISFFDNWQRDKSQATRAIGENKKYNADIKRTLPADIFNKNKKKFPLGELDSAVLLCRTIPNLLHSQCGIPESKYLIKGSVGQGQPAEVPWVCIFDRDITSSAQVGYYIVYLFDQNSRGVYLSLNQGWTQYEKIFGVKRGLENIKDNALKSKALLKSDQGFNYADINLGTSRSLGKGYEAGNICSIYYKADDLPSDTEITNDLRNLIGVYRELKGIVGSNILSIEIELNEEEFQSKSQSGIGATLPAGGIARRDKSIQSKSSSWTRDPIMANIAITKAGYKCENDSAHKTFLSEQSNQNFVEAHHLIPMRFQDDFEFSIDVPENIISLCPNCHRAFHNSKPEIKNSLLRKFLIARMQLLEQREISVEEKLLLKYYSC